MSRATHCSLVLARFDDLRATGPVESPNHPESLFLRAGADVRASNSDAMSQQAYKFVIFGLHASESAARQAVDRKLESAGWLSDARETWSAVLVPFRHFGESNFLNPESPGPLYDVSQPEPSAETPIVVMTSVGWTPSSIESDMDRIADFSRGVAAVRIGMTAVDGLHSQQTFSFPGGLELDGITVTMWRNFAAMRDFAYGPGLHRHQVKRQREELLGDRSSFTRFTVLHSEGTWHGSCPLTFPQPQSSANA